MTCQTMSQTEVKVFNGAKMFLVSGLYQSPQKRTEVEIDLTDLLHSCCSLSARQLFLKPAKLALYLCLGAVCR